MRRATLIGVVAGVAAVVAVVAVSVVWPGLDAKHTPAESTSMWALQTGQGKRYARVNTALGELDTVRSVSNPTALATTDAGTYLWSDSFGRLTRIDDALPADLDDKNLHDSPSTPPGTVDAAVSGDWVAYRTDSGAVYAGTLSHGTVQLDPSGGAQGGSAEYTSDALTVDDSGTLYSYSATDGAVLRYRIPTARVLGRDPVPGRPKGSTLGLTAAGGAWFLIDTANGRQWQRGAARARTVALTGTIALGRSVAAGDAAYIADEVGLVRLPVDGSAPVRLVGGKARDYGTPARPVVQAGQVFAAWLRADGGTLWRSGSGEGETALDYAGRSLADDRRPVFVGSGGAMILNDTKSGWVWTMPRGALVASSQDWTLGARTDSQAQPSDEQAQVVLEPRPPVAEPDTFGVRPGALVSLPVLLNDHDPNTDVLSIDPGSVTGLDPAFGSLSLTDDNQRIAVRVSPTAHGTATFSYRDTDGTGAGGGLFSQPTTVTLHAVASGNSAPQWCGVPGCLAQWPTPQVAPGGTVTVPVLDGWVDPEGDPVMLLSVTNLSGVGAVAATPEGEVVYQHPDPSQRQAQAIELAVTVSDTHGATATKDLTVQVSTDPQPTAQSFTVVDTQRDGFAVDVAPHVSGTAGALRLTAVRVLDQAPADAVAAPGTTSFEFTAARPGTYRVNYTVSDGAKDATATARITILPDAAGAQLATAPVTVFVHPGQDSTVDVFSAVSNPAHRVLLLSDVASTSAGAASMTVDAVGQRYLRVTGSTADGAPGLLGTVRYTVSDGTSDAGASVQGEATVYLLPPAPELSPIAVDDAVVVRAGAQVDIPVLDNDVAPAGGVMLLNPASVHSSTTQALAFASGRMLRYLAPTKAGQYSVEYSVYTAGSPQLADSATVHITVISTESNRPPRPETLEGRVLSGQSVVIPFTSFGVDPDGDAVRLDRILTQPAHGSAAISADGEAIVYTSRAGYSGPDSFGYQVADTLGATGTASVRVGVLAAQADPSPVTFTDYVQVQVGADNTARISPLANDIDPSGGTLTLTGVRPDLTATLADGSQNPEYLRQKALIREQTSSSVLLGAGTTPGTMSFLYDVLSSSGNTGRGLIVVKAVRESVPDYPVVTDTLLTAETRGRLAGGVDVVTGKVSWTGGDVSSLRLSLWGQPEGMSVEGFRLRGPLPAHTRIVPFALTGRGAGGQTVTSYGFLRIPGDDDLTLALRSGTRPREVTERQSVDFDMARLVALPPGGALQVGRDVAASGARPAAQCAVEAGTIVRYTAGEGAPWTDFCTVPVRLAGHADWTYLSVPIRVRAIAPQPVLSTASIVVSPGQTVSYDLATMTSWEGKVGTGVVYRISHSGSTFSVSQSGSTLTVTGADSAVPGTDDGVTVEITSYPSVAPARLILRVGAAPSLLPQGGTATRQCSEASGPSCTITVVGASGEVNPLPRTPLRVIDVHPTGVCTGVSFAVASPTTVTASWAPDAPGATCTAAFTLIDAQGRSTGAARAGALLLDLQGYPKAPAALVQSGYADGSLTLRVDPGDARLAYPSLTGFVVRQNGAVVATCTPDGTCPAIAAPNGERRVYQAWAVNAVGESAAAASTSAWAYRPPPAPTSVTAVPVVTGGDGGVVALTVAGVDTTSVGYLMVTSPLGERVRVDIGAQDGTVSIPAYRVGSNTQSPVTVTPYTRFAVPPGLPGSASGSAVTLYTNGIGRPTSPAVAADVVADGDGTDTITLHGSAALNGDGSQLRYGFAISGNPCTVSRSGTSATFRNLADGLEYSFDLCVESFSGGQSFGRTTLTTVVRAVQQGTPPVGYTFVVDGTPLMDAGGLAASWIIRAVPTSPQSPPRLNDAVFTGLSIGATPMTTVMGRDPGIGVYYQHRIWGTRSATAPVVAAPGSAPYQVQAGWRVASCVGGSDLQAVGSSTNGIATITFDRAGLTYIDAAGAVLPHADSWAVPVGAVAVSGIGVTVDWSAAGWGLNSATRTFSASCDPNIPPAQP